MKSLVFAFVMIFSTLAHAEYMGVFEAGGYDDVAVFKENGKLIMRTEVTPSKTDVYTILPNEDDYLFGSNGRQSKINGVVVEVLGMSGAYNGLLKTTYKNGLPVSSVMYLLVGDRCDRSRHDRRTWTND